MQAVRKAGWSTDKEMRERFPIIWPVYFKHYDPDIAARLLENSIVTISGGARDGEFQVIMYLHALAKFRFQHLLWRGAMIGSAHRRKHTFYTTASPIQSWLSSKIVGTCPMLKSQNYSSGPCATGSNAQIEYHRDAFMESRAPLQPVHIWRLWPDLNINGH